MSQKNFIVVLVILSFAIIIYFYSSTSQNTLLPEETRKKQTLPSNFSEETSILKSELQSQTSIFVKKEPSKSQQEKPLHENPKSVESKKSKYLLKVDTTIKPEDSAKVKEFKTILETKRIDFTSLDMPFVEVFHVFEALVGIPMIIDTEIEDDLNRVLSIEIKEGQAGKILNTCLMVNDFVYFYEEDGIHITKVKVNDITFLDDYKNGEEVMNELFPQLDAAKREYLQQTIRLQSYFKNIDINESQKLGISYLRGEESKARELLNPGIDENTRNEMVKEILARFFYQYFNLLTKEQQQKLAKAILEKFKF